MAFEKGKSGNPAGRPQGSRQKFTEAFWNDFASAWAENGKGAIDELRAVDPATFVRVAASLMPKETNVVLRNELDSMTDEQLREFIRYELAFSGNGSAEPAELTVKGITH